MGLQVYWLCAGAESRQDHGREQGGEEHGWLVARRYRGAETIVGLWPGPEPEGRTGLHSLLEIGHTEVSRRSPKSD